MSVGIIPTHVKYRIVNVRITLYRLNIKKKKKNHHIFNIMRIVLCSCSKRFIFLFKLRYYDYLKF